MPVLRNRPCKRRINSRGHVSIPIGDNGCREIARRPAVPGGETGTGTNTPMYGGGSGGGAPCGATISSTTMSATRSNTNCDIARSVRPLYRNLNLGPTPIGPPFRPRWGIGNAQPDGSRARHAAVTHWPRDAKLPREPRPAQKSLEPSAHPHRYNNQNAPGNGRWPAHRA